MRHQIGHLADVRSTHETMRGLTASVCDQREWRHLLHGRGYGRTLHLWLSGGEIINSKSLADKMSKTTYHLQLALDLGVELAVAGATSLAFIAVNGRLQFRWVAQILFLALVWVQVLHVSERGGRELIKEKPLTLLHWMATRAMKRSAREEEGEVLNEVFLCSSGSAE